MGAVTDSDTGSVIAYAACKRAPKAHLLPLWQGQHPLHRTELLGRRGMGARKYKWSTGALIAHAIFGSRRLKVFVCVGIERSSSSLGFLLPRRAECLPARGHTGTVTCASHVMKHEPRRITFIKVAKLQKCRQLDRSCDVTLSLFVPCSRASSPRDAFRPQSLSS